ncbi:hypothetical protein [Uliginosibacterium sp. H1]|uniref:hypothetical protein n=1 Tax=Uliginosibacterium sp. H1 TaxID=3114757 RepID=UPI002E19FC28|nr:hypothetical protein [Uliginosibacterium sp. H1]
MTNLLPLPMTLIARIASSFCAALLCLGAAQAQQAPARTTTTGERATLRIACEGDAMDAEVIVNGEFKGECPLDFSTPAGTIELRVVKKLGSTQVRSFEKSLRMGGGTARRIDVELGPPTLTEEGRRIEEARRQREQVEAARLAIEKAEAARRERAQERARIDAEVDQMLASARARNGISPIEGCPDCPPTLRPASRPKVEMPATSEPTLAVWLPQARAEVQAYLADDGASFRPPAQAQPLPCESAAFAMRKLAGLLDPEERTPEEQHEWRERIKPLQLKRYVEYLRDVKLWLVQAQCEQGRLSGPLSFWASGLLVTDTEVYSSVEPRLVRVDANMVAGEAEGLVRQVTRRSGALSRFAGRPDAGSTNPPGTRHEWINLTYRHANPGLAPQALTITFFLGEKADVSRFFEHTRTIFSVPQGNGRSENLEYDGLRPAARSFSRNGFLHGEMTIFAFSQPTGLLTPDIKYPGQTVCYRNGAAVVMNPCRVD